MRTLAAVGMVLSLMILITPDAVAQGRGGKGQRGMRGRSDNGCQGQMTQQWQMRIRYGMTGQRGRGRQGGGYGRRPTSPLARTATWTAPSPKKTSMKVPSSSPVNSAPGRKYAANRHSFAFTLATAFARSSKPHISHGHSESH
jgi:hypothetical protein